MKKGKNIVLRKYYLRWLPVLIIYIIFAALGFWLFSFLWFLISLALLSFVYIIVIRIIANKTINSVLFDELDAPKFYETIMGRGFVPTLQYRINAAVALGDHQTIINLATSQLRKKRASVKVRDTYLCILANAYFELGDYEKLQILLAKHEDYKKQYPTETFLHKQNSKWSYYKYFFEQNYEACKTVCDQRNLGLNPKAIDTKIGKLINDFCYAVACYKNNETELAKIRFERIAANAPKMCYATLSLKYLQAIESGSEDILLSNSEILPEENFDDATSKRVRRCFFIRRIIWVLSLALILTGVVADCAYERKYNSAKSEFEDKLSDAVSRSYENGKFIKHFGVKKGKEYIETLCIVETPNGMDLTTVVTYDGGETSDLLIIKKNLEVEKSYCLKSPISDYYIGFTIYKNRPFGKDHYHLEKFEFNEDTYWICIDYIETKFRPTV